MFNLCVICKDLESSEVTFEIVKPKCDECLTASMQ